VYPAYRPVRPNYPVADYEQPAPEYQAPPPRPSYNQPPPPPSYEEAPPAPTSYEQPPPFRSRGS
jgi:hypothetical protein